VMLKEINHDCLAFAVRRSHHAVLISTRGKEETMTLTASTQSTPAVGITIGRSSNIGRSKR
jgi:hypothetical protein